MVFVANVAAAQSVSHRGFIDVSNTLYPQKAINDPVRAVGDVLVREEVFVRPSSWLQLAAGGDARANTHDQVDYSSGVDVSDRGRQRPVLALRRLSATVARGRATVDVGKQFIRWGTTDILTPTDWFAPRDFLNVIDTEFLPVLGARASLRADVGTLDVVWVPRFTPSRVPLYDQRWTVVPPAAGTVTIVDDGAIFPEGSQTGVRWSHSGSGLDYAAAFFDGYNHQPSLLVRIPTVPTASASLVREVGLTRVYPRIRAYGADAAVALRWFTVKVEASYVTSPSAATDEYALYVLQLERQTGEWAFVGGYTGEHVTGRRVPLSFAPDRGLTRAFVGRASYTIDPNRSLAFDAVVRRNGAGAYVKAEYSQAYGQHWRVIVDGALIRGEDGDFLGQYHRNSHGIVRVRYSF
jgi:hypothetical protein